MLPSASDNPSDARINWCTSAMVFSALPLACATVLMLSASGGASGYGATLPMFAVLFSYILMLAVCISCAGYLFYSLQKGKIRTPKRAQRLILIAILALVMPLALFS